MAIPNDIFRSTITNAVVATYEQLPEATGFLSGNFPSVFGGTKILSTYSRFFDERVASDVSITSNGHENLYSKSDQKAYEPVFFYERIPVSDIDGYFRQWNNPMISAGEFSDIKNEIAIRFADTRNTILRRKELMIAEIFNQGYFTTSKGDTANYGRIGDSFIDLGAGNYWNDAGVDPYEQMNAIGTFFRKEAKDTSPTIIGVMGEAAAAALSNNPIFSDKQKRFQNNFDRLIPVNRLNGANYKGTYDCIDYKVEMYTYPQYYKDPTTGVLTPYVPTNKVFYFPAKNNFLTAHGEIPMLPSNLTGGMNEGISEMTNPNTSEFVVNMLIDQQRTTVEYGMKARFIPILLNKMQMATQTVVAP